MEIIGIDSNKNSYNICYVFPSTTNKSSSYVKKWEDTDQLIVNLTSFIIPAATN